MKRALALILASIPWRVRLAVVPIRVRLTWRRSSTGAVELSLATVPPDAVLQAAHRHPNRDSVFQLSPGTSPTSRSTSCRSGSFSSTLRRLSPPRAPAWRRHRAG
jgi:hypothetical protein